MKKRTLFFLNCLALLLFFSFPIHAATFLESGGRVVIEAESSTAIGGWSRENSVAGAKGGAYLVWEGPNLFSANNAGRDTLRYTFRVQNAGNYELRWRSYIAEGNNATEANDSWVRFPTGSNIAGQHPLNGWTKAFQNQRNQWSWSAKTVDNVGRPIRQFFSAGDHVIEISGRSKGHAIDRLVMFRYNDVRFSQSLFESFTVSSTVNGSVPPTTPEPPTTPTTPEPPATPTTPATPTPPVAGGTCRIISGAGASIRDAIAQFNQQCAGLKRKDCDPVSGNRWMCSTGNINANTPLTAVTPGQPQQPEVPATPEPATPVPTTSEPATPVAPVQPPTGSACEGSGTNLSLAIKAYNNNCPNIPRKDCDPVGNGRWTCSSAVIGDSAPGGSTPTVQPTSVQPTPVQPTPVQPTPVQPTPVQPATAEPSTTEPPTPGGSIGRVDSNDLVVLNYDNCPDRDDGHALAAGKAVVVRSGLSDVLVVNGTCGDVNRGSYQRTSEAVVRAVWGSDWLDYFNDGEATVQAAALRFAEVLANDGDVWVAEGGPSDFTARVVRRIRSQFPSLDVKFIHVIQHSHGVRGFNELNTSANNLAYLKQQTDYIAIPNGNILNNGTAGFSNLSSFFVQIARQSEFSAEWNAAFNYLNPNRRLDFSDTVELLYIINETSTKTIDDFARRYLR